MEILQSRICTGVFIRQFADCRVTEEGGWFASRARCHNKGALDEYRRSKAAYDAVKEKFENWRSDRAKAIWSMG